MEEKVFETWEINSSERKFIYSTALLVVVFITVFTFFTIYLVSNSTNIILLATPILLGIIVISSLPDYLATFRIFRYNTKVKITETGVSISIVGEASDVRFLPWEHIKQYDLVNFKNSSLLGFLFPKPKGFIMESVYPEESFGLLAFGENADVLLAYLKEHNIVFGYVKKT